MCISSSVKSLGLFALTMGVLMSVSPVSARALPQFSANLFTKAKTMTVDVDSVGNDLLRVRVTESEDGRTFADDLRKGGFDIPDHATVEFLIPAVACVFKGELLNCDSHKLGAGDHPALKVSIYNSHDLLIHEFNGTNLSEHALQVKISTRVQTEKNLTGSGQLVERKSLSFHSDVFIYVSSRLSSLAFHALENLNISR